MGLVLAVATVVAVVTEQAVHAVASARAVLYRPAGHAEHAVLLPRPEYPGKQRHALAAVLVALVVLACVAHDEQLPSARSDLYRAYPHARHVLALATPLYPGTHLQSVTSVLAVELVLALGLHVAQAPSAKAVLYCPYAHAAHATLPVPAYPAEHLQSAASVLATALVLACATHDVHVPASASAVLYRPSGHGVHDVLPTPE